MKQYNIIFLVDVTGENVLMCRRVKPPYEGLLNLVGGKVQPGEDGRHAAYRELREETGVTAAEVALRPVVTFSYPAGGSGLPPYALMAYAGRLRHPVVAQGEENPLVWVPLTENFFDMTRFAGEGNIGHIAAYIARYCPEMTAVRAADVRLEPLSAAHLDVLAFYQAKPAEQLRPMLAESIAREHEGRYYEQFAICADGCMVGLASLYAHEGGAVSDGVEVFPPFRRCGFGARALNLLMDAAGKMDYSMMTAQVRTDNVASIALHRRAGFAPVRCFVNRRGNEVYEMHRQRTVRHEMNLRPGPFRKIASGEKTYELRLHDEKRRQIRVGDEILFTCTADERTVLTRVTELRPFADFAALYAALPLTKCGYTPENVHLADPRDMEAYYPPEKQRDCGVLAIGVERVRFPLKMLQGDFSVRELTAADVPEMLRVARGNPQYYRCMGIEPDAENLAACLTALPPKRTLADKHFFAWFDGDRVVAMMDLIARHPSDAMAFIGWFIVDADRQGAGLGQRLIAQVMAMLECCGVREVRLGRIEGNPQSEAFWHACGFVDMTLGYDTDGYHVTVMQKVLQ